MRIISQCGTMDIPYESIVLSLVDNGNGCSVMAFSDCLSNGVTVARYSNDENAKKAMDLLHESYTGVRFVSIPDNSISFEDLIKECEKGVISVPASKEYPTFGNYDGCCVFKFPSDNEVKYDKSKAI